MANVNNTFRSCVVIGSVVFVMYWTGILHMIGRMLLALLLMPFSSLRIQYVGDAHQQKAKPSAGPDPIMDELDQVMKKNEEAMGNHVMEVVNIMEDLVASNDMEYMSDAELEETFGNLYDMFPLMDKLFDMALKEDALSSINPRYDYHSTHRRYEAMRKALEKKRAERLAAKVEQSQPPGGDDEEGVMVEEEL